jgi:hypothetical protein
MNFSQQEGEWYRIEIEVEWCEWVSEWVSVGLWFNYCSSPTWILVTSLFHWKPQMYMMEQWKDIVQHVPSWW